MRRRDLGTAALAGLGLVALGAPREAEAADELVKSSGWKAESKKGSDGKFYVLPNAKVSLKPGMAVTFKYEGMQGEPPKPTFKVVDNGKGTGSVSFDQQINGTPSSPLATSPAQVVIIDATGSHPIDVQQPGG